MKITDFRQDEIRPTEARLAQPEKAPAKRIESRSEASTDRITISPFSETLLGELDSTKRVEALKASYEAGTYRVDPESLAKALVKVHLALPRSASAPEPVPDDGKSGSVAGEGSAPEAKTRSAS